MKIIVEGVPIAKKRPRFFRKGNHVGTYNSQETEEGRWLLEAKGQVIAPLTGPISVMMKFLMPIPKSSPKALLRSVWDGKTIWHTKKPDLDNLVKFAKDCLNNVAWKDDSQVCELCASKMYDQQPRTEIYITSC